MTEALFPIHAEGWAIVTLGEAVRLGGGNIQTGPFGSQLHAADYVEDGVPSVMPQNIGDNRIHADGIARITESDAKRLSKYRLSDGDIVYSRRGDVERRSLVRSSNEGWLCGTGCLRVRFGTGYVVPAYAAYYLGHSSVREWIVQHAVGATMPNLNTGILSSVPFILPPLETQLEIAFALSNLDDKIELNRRMNETLEAMAQAVFRDWFVDFGPVRRKLAGETDPVAIMGGLTPDLARAAELAALFPRTLKDDGLPEGWFEFALSGHLEIIGGGTPKTSVEAYWGGTIPWFSVVDTPTGSDTFVFATEKTVTEAAVAGSSARLVPAGTTIISARGTVGNLAVAAQDMTFNQSCYALRSTRGDHPYFVYLTAARAVERLRAMAHGSVFSTITRQTFDSLTFPQAPLPLVDAFEATVEPLFNRLRASVAENRTLVETRDYLLPRLMSGAVRVEAAR